MGATSHLKRWSELWSDPERAIKTLESFAETEADGARDIRAAAERTSDSWLKDHFLRHADDEHKHAEMFRKRAREMRAEHPEVPIVEGEKRFDIAQSRDHNEVNSHGFLLAGLLDDLGEVPYVAMLHVAEQKAEKLFRTQVAATAGQPETRAVFEEILKDELYHVSYTKTALDQWKKRGRGREVSDAMSNARGRRFLSAWKRLGVRAAGNFGRLVLIVCYWTVLAPFGLIARAGRDATGFAAPQTDDPGSQLESQY